MASRREKQPSTEHQNLSDLTDSPPWRKSDGDNKEAPPSREILLDIEFLMSQAQCTKVEAIAALDHGDIVDAITHLSPSPWGSKQLEAAQDHWKRLMAGHEKSLKKAGRRAYLGACIRAERKGLGSNDPKQTSYDRRRAYAERKGLGPNDLKQTSYDRFSALGAYEAILELPPLEQIVVRQEYAQKVSWMMLTSNNIRALTTTISELSTTERMCILEIGAGMGRVAELMKVAHRARIIDMPGGFAYIATSLEARDWAIGDGVENISAIEALEYAPTANCLISIWPECEGEWCKEAIEAFRRKATAERKIVHLIYIGEQEGGCTGTGSLFEEFREWTEITSVKLECWQTIHDALFVYSFDGAH